MESGDQFDRLASSLIRFWRLLAQQSGLAYEEKSITVLQIHLITLLEAQPGLTMSELATTLHISLPSATQAIDRLVKLGLADRLHDQDDKRIIRIQATPAGTQTLHEMKAQRREQLRQLLVTVPTSDVQECIRIHEKIIAILEETNPLDSHV